MKVEDILGNELKAGDTIAYPRRSGSALWMTTGVIVAIEEFEDWWSKKKFPMLKVMKKSGRKTHVTAVDRVIRIQP